MGTQMKRFDIDSRGKALLMLAVGVVLAFAGGVIAETVCWLIINLR